MQFDDIPVRNQLLAALGASDLAGIKPDFETVRVDLPTPLFGAGGSIDHVYFPETAVVSLVSTPRERRTPEVNAVGREGMAGLSVFLSGYGSSVQAFAQAPGIARRMDARVFRRLSAAPGPFHQVMLRYTQAFLARVSQTVTCNGAHLLQERCAGWLLLKRDRVDANEFPFSPAFLSLVLDVRLDGVTLAMRSLQGRGLIRCNRDRVEILDAVELERESCECHGLVRTEYARLLARVA